MSKGVPQDIMDTFLDALTAHRTLRLWESYDALVSAATAVRKYNATPNLIDLDAEKPKTPRRVDGTGTDPIAWMLDQARKARYLSGWERLFLESVERWYRRTHHLSAAQQEKLAQIIRDRT